MIAFDDNDQPIELCSDCLEPITEHGTMTTTNPSDSVAQTQTTTRHKITTDVGTVELVDRSSPACGDEQVLWVASDEGGMTFALARSDQHDYHHASMFLHGERRVSFFVTTPDSSTVMMMVDRPGSSFVAYLHQPISEIIAALVAAQDEATARNQTA